MRWEQNREIAWRKIDGDVLLVDPGDAMMRQLNPVAAEVWERLEAPQSLDDLVAHVCAAFDVGPETARTDIQAFLDKLSERKLIEKSG